MTALFWATAVAAAPAAPIALHPDNPRVFLWRGRPTLLLTSGEHYGAVLNLDFDYVRYLDALAADGLNLTRTFAGTYREIPGSFNITDNPLGPLPNRYAAPWARSDTPGYCQGGNKFDLTRWDDAYWARLRDFMAQAQQRGVVVELDLFCTFYNDELWRACPMNAESNVNGLGNCPRTEVLTLQHDDLTQVQLAFVRKAVAELRDFDNLYYEVCNEPYFNNVTWQWQRKIAETIAAAERDFPAKHLISLNINNGRQKVEDPPPEVSIYNFHYCVPPDTVAMNWGLNKVIGENETGFRGSHDLLYRTEAWDFMLAGGALYNNLDYSFTPPHPDGTFLDYRSPGGGSPALRHQLGVLKRFLEGFDFVHLAPNHSVVKSVEPELTHYALSEPGKQYAIVLHLPVPNKPEHPEQLDATEVQAKVSLELPAGRYQAEWVDTKTGEVIGRAELRGSGDLASPTFKADIALRITARE